MSNPSSPLLVANKQSERPLSHRSAKSNRSNTTRHHRNYGGAPTHESNSAAASSLRSLQGCGLSKGKTSRRWPSIVAFTLLSVAILAILGIGFTGPAIVEEYAKEATVFEPTGLSIDSFTSTGVNARIQGDFILDGSRVHKKSVRDLGRAGTWIARAVESKESRVKVFLPEYDNLLLGTAIVPPIVISIKDGVTTHVDFISELSAGDIG